MSKSHKKWSMIVIVWIVGIMSVNISIGGEYITYVNPKTGVRYFGDSLPVNTPQNVKVEVRQHSTISRVGSNWTAAEHNKAELLSAITPKPAPQVPQQPSASEIAIRQNNQQMFDKLEHMSNKPLPPTRGRAAAQFNMMTNAYERYESDMLEWRMKGHDMGYKYTPTGFSEGERRYIESIGSFDLLYRRK